MSQIVLGVKIINIIELLGFKELRDFESLRVSNVFCCTNIRIFWGEIYCFIFLIQDSRCILKM